MRMNGTGTSCTAGAPLSVPVSDMFLPLSAGYGTGPERRRLEKRCCINALRGGRGWDRTSDPYDVNVVLSR